ncbi:hypothetical protein YPPY15_1603, partial [Yersinia pestis PY-15]|jgi:phosphoacetylglucosamine mutase
MTQ